MCEESKRSEDGGRARGLFDLAVVARKVLRKKTRASSVVAHAFWRSGGERAKATIRHTYTTTTVPVYSGQPTHIQPPTRKKRPSANQPQDASLSALFEITKRRKSKNRTENEVQPSIFCAVVRSSFDSFPLRVRLVHLISHITHSPLFLLRLTHHSFIFALQILPPSLPFPPSLSHPSPLSPPARPLLA